jgi:hypothetical protein
MCYVYSSRLYIDIDIIFDVLGRSIESLGFGHPRWRREKGMKELYQMAESQIDYFHRFWRLVLGSIEGGGGGLSNLRLLSVDPETSRHFKMKIAAYADVPIGSQLRLARRVFSAAEYLLSRFHYGEARDREAVEESS